MRDCRRWSSTFLRDILVVLLWYCRNWPQSSPLNLPPGWSYGGSDCASNVLPSWLFCSLSSNFCVFLARPRLLRSLRHHQARPSYWGLRRNLPLGIVTSPRWRLVVCSNRLCGLRRRSVCSCLRGGSWEWRLTLFISPIYIIPSFIACWLASTPPFSFCWPSSQVKWSSNHLLSCRLTSQLNTVRVVFLTRSRITG